MIGEEGVSAWIRVDAGWQGRRGLVLTPILPADRVWHATLHPASPSTHPPESFNPMTGAPTLSARSITLQIFLACVSDSEPERVVGYARVAWL